MHTCVRCHKLFDAVRIDARWCSASCRAADHRAAKAAHLDAAKALLMAQTRAIQDGADVTVLAELARQAERLFATA